MSAGGWRLSAGGALRSLENRPFNAHHATREASFYCFECEDDDACAEALFARAFEWAQARGLSRVVGPKGFSAFDGYGILVAGFEHRPMMTMTNYNLAYYGPLLERVRRAASRAREQGSLRVVAMTSRRALIKVARAIGEAYNKTHRIYAREL